MVLISYAGHNIRRQLSYGTVLIKKKNCFLKNALKN